MHVRLRQTRRTTRHLYLGAANGWIFQSRDGGKKWERLARVGKRDDLVIDNILVDPAEPKHIVVGAWVAGPSGWRVLYQQTMAGSRGRVNPEMEGQSVRALTSAPPTRRLWWPERWRVFSVRVDGGRHWAADQPEAVAEIHEVESLAIDPPIQTSFTRARGTCRGRRRTAERHWTNIKQGSLKTPMCFRSSSIPSSSNVVYLSACSGIYKSEDGGGEVSTRFRGFPRRHGGRGC